MLHILLTVYAPYSNLQQVKLPTFDPNDEHLVLTLFLDIAAALHEVHARSIAHLDLKPDNILLTSSGHAILADFEFAVIGDLQCSFWECCCMPCDSRVCLSEEMGTW